MTSSIQLIQIAAKKAGLDEDTRRAKLMNIVGISSTRQMTEDQRQQVLTVFFNEGFKVTSPKGSGRTLANTRSGKYASAIRAFWLSGYNLGVFRESDDRAILKFARNQTGLEHVQFAVAAGDGKAIIEAIKAIVRRDARFPELWRPVKSVPRDSCFQDARVQVLFAQWLILQRLNAAPGEKLVEWCAFPGAEAAIRNLDGPVLIEMQKALGRLIRAAKTQGK